MRAVAADRARRWRSTASPRSASPAPRSRSATRIRRSTSRGRVLVDHLDDAGIGAGAVRALRARAFSPSSASASICPSCAATGERATTSPSCRRRAGGPSAPAAGEPYKDRLLALPGFLIGQTDAEPSPRDEIRAGFALTEFFLQHTRLRAARAAGAGGARAFRRAGHEKLGTSAGGLCSSLIASMSTDAAADSRMRISTFMGKPVNPPSGERHREHQSQGGAGGALSRLCALDHHAPGAARRARRPEARAPAHPARHAAAAPRSRPGASRNAPASSATSSASTTRTATRRSTTRSCAWRRISRSAIRSSTGRAISATSTAITPPPMRYTEARLTEVARLLLEGIDEDAVDFRDDLRRRGRGAGRAAGRLPEPARQRLAGHRGRHGDVDPAAQRRRALRRGALPDHAIRRRRPSSCCTFVPGPDFPTGGIIVEPPAVDRRDLPHRPRLVPRAGALGARRRPAAAPGTSSSPRSPTRVPKARLIEKIAELLAREEAAAARRRARRIGRGRARRAGAARPHRRSGHADGIAVPADRAREPHPDEHERARRRQGAEGARPRRMPARMARPSPRGAAAPLALPARGRSTSAWRSCGGLLIVYLDLDRVIKIIREEDEPKPELMRVFKLTDVQAERHPRHAPALAAQARGDGAQARARRADRRRRRRSRTLLGSDEDAVEDDRLARSARCRRPSGPTPRSASAAPPSPRRRTPPTSTSPRRWSSASRSP